jgi:hypothetical protein
MGDKGIRISGNQVAGYQDRRRRREEGRVASYLSVRGYLVLMAAKKNKKAR